MALTTKTRTECSQELNFDICKKIKYFEVEIYYLVPPGNFTKCSQRLEILTI